ncbi:MULTISPECIES: hypothetical protein [unclassified Nitrosospira]|uniref:hypothetical protein n=1 Tax=unclassified Nitrosospira TaxID=2609267 RepID=UPI0009346456|nr:MULTISPECIES: hypothetical protein [unclassified Nitrosospira]
MIIRPKELSAGQARADAGKSRCYQATGFPKGGVVVAINRVNIFVGHYRIEARFRLKNTS